MAVWQFSLELIPDHIAKVDGVDAICVDLDQPCFLKMPVARAQSALERFGRLMVEKQAWSSGMRIWGDEKTSDIQVWFGEEDRQTIDAIAFRFDMRDLSLPMVGEACAVARELGCLLVTREGMVVRPTYEAVVRMALQSPAMKFVKDPEEFIRAAIARDRTE